MAYVPPSRRVAMFTTKPGMMFSTSSMTRVPSRMISNSPVSLPSLVTTNVTGPAAVVTVAGEQPSSLTETAIRSAVGSPAPPAALTGADHGDRWPDRQGAACAWTSDGLLRQVSDSAGDHEFVMQGTLTVKHRHDCISAGSGCGRPARPQKIACPSSIADRQGAQSDDQGPGHRPAHMHVAGPGGDDRGHDQGHRDRREDGPGLDGDRSEQGDEQRDPGAEEIGDGRTRGPPRTRRAS